MARLPYLDADQTTDPDLVADLYKRLTGWGRPVAHLYKVLANQPPALQAFLGMSHYIREQSSLDGALREIAILSTAQALEQPYERAHHEPVARSLGVEARTIEALAAGDFDQLEALPRAVATYADQVARRHGADAEVFEQLRQHLSDGEVTDLVLTVAWYHLCAAILGPLQVEVEPERALP
jgi:alkylhydroperoxidase family enzyme